jgi:2-isopropylmalate synthase
MDGSDAQEAQAVPAVDDAQRVHIFDTTLRDGEQSPGISLNVQEKVEIAQQLARLGVDVIEAGFPITSPGDFEAVQAISRGVEGPVICGLARTHKADIDAAWGAIKEANRPRIHTFISTSDIHIEHQLQTTREDVKGQAKAAVALAKSLCEDVEFSPMDATRADVEFTAEVCAIAVAEGANVVNIPDTVGYTTPEEYTRYFQRLYELAPELRDVRLSVHCHQDLGMAVANSYAGLLAGARQVECAINGIGERAGNCSLEEIVMLLRTRRDEHGLDTGCNTTELARTSRMVSRFTGYAVQPNKAIVGRNAFAHESGIHQDGVLKERITYEIMDARDVGLDSNSIVLGKHSGRHALRDALEQLGFKVEGNALNQAFKRFKEIADKKKQVTALDLEAIVSDQVRSSAQSYELVWFDVEASSRRPPTAKVALKMPSGEESVGESGGDGPVDAIFGAIGAATGVEAELRQYTVSAVTEGDDALGEVTVVLRAHGRLASGQGVATDILEASARAYVRALSNALEGAAVREAEEVAADAATQPVTPGP